MFETNTQTNSASLISLSHAAQLTGYHQDYLGQLCRIGRLSATKVGRNWFTSKEALSSLSSVLPQAVVETVGEENYDQSSVETPGFDFVQPAIAQTITVSQVEGLPIAIQTLPTPVRNINSVQNILTAMRIESLQREVLELRQLLNRLMAEVRSHAAILQGRSVEFQRADQLRHSYVSNFDFNTPYSTRSSLQAEANLSEEQPQIAQNLTWPYATAPLRRPGYAVFAWVTATAVAVAVVGIGASMFTGQFFGSPPSQGVQTVYYHSKSDSESANGLVREPTVAGATLPPAPVETLR